MTTQNQESGQTHDLAFCGFRNDSNRNCAFAKVAQDFTFKCLSAVTGRGWHADVDLANGCEKTIAGSWDKNMGWRLSSLLEPKAIRSKESSAGTMEMKQGSLRHFHGYYGTGCEILKQLADRFHYKCGLWVKTVRRQFMSGIYRHRINVSNGLNEREAKFFLDREKQSRYNALKFSGGFPARAKIHLHRERKIVNCCSRFWEGADQPLVGHESTRFREAETGRPNQVDESIPQLRSLRDDRPVGVISIPSAHGRRRI